MNCLNCNTPLTSLDYCPSCGADMSILKRIERISNLSYNEGLDKATVRDLSGAIECLKRSLKFNKNNIQARNLLGLVYFETGEVVSALSEWVISKNLQPEDNIADTYIQKLQASPNRLNTINQTLRKYNQALLYCHEGSEDMAVIQLKKVLSQNPKLIKGKQLLALIYIRNKEYEKARKILKKAAKIDNTNTITLRYIQEVNEATGTVTSLESPKIRRREQRQKVGRFGSIQYTDGNETIIQPATFQESSIIATFINLGLGLLVGVAVVWFLVIPAKRQSYEEKANTQLVEFSNQLSVQKTEIEGLKAEVAKSDSIQSEADKKIEEANKKAESYDNFLKVAKTFYVDGDKEGAATIMENIEPDSLSEEGKAVYQSILEETKQILFNKYYEVGNNAYARERDYKKAIDNLEKAVSVDPDNFDALYYLAFSYYYSDDKGNADKYFKSLVEKFPDKAAEQNLSSYITGEQGEAETNEPEAAETNEPEAGN